MKREILVPVTILALALLAAAGAPAMGVLASNAAFGAETTVVTASLGADGRGLAAQFSSAGHWNTSGQACR
ncbi:MAG TPA: hypothetical protein VM325_07945 [Alphaproteobacteria bacterium]|nr:hypothetical protein [Alphaproteobacteria bacterium]